MQNQTGQSPLKWGSTGTVVEAAAVTIHHEAAWFWQADKKRRFLKKYLVKPYIFCDHGQPAAPAAPVATQDTALRRRMRIGGLQGAQTQGSQRTEHNHITRGCLPLGYSVSGCLWVAMPGRHERSLA